MKTDQNTQYAARIPTRSYLRGLHRAGTQAFTLIEMLTVVAIILILAALLTPAVKKLFEHAARQKAGARVQVVAHAIKQYETIYGKWPGQTQGNEDGLVDLALVVSNLTYNPRSVILIEYPPSWLSTNGTFRDPWDRELYIAMDENRDGLVEVKATSPVIFTENVSNETVAIISWGANPEDERDRIFSWIR